MKNEPHPTSLPVGGYVNYRKRRYYVVLRNGDLYMIRDVKNRNIVHWVRPEHVEIAPL